MNTPHTDIQYFQNGEFDDVGASIPDMIDQGAMATEQERQSRGDVSSMNLEIATELTRVIRWAKSVPISVILCILLTSMISRSPEHQQRCESTEALLPLISIEIIQWLVLDTETSTSI